MKFYRRAKKLIQLEIGLFHHFFPLHPISLCSKVLIPSSNLWRASPTSFRASKKVKNWQNITFSWTGECTHTQLLCLYGDNLMCCTLVNITIQKEESGFYFQGCKIYIFVVLFWPFIVGLLAIFFDQMV